VDAPALVIRGDAGIGKTAVLDEAISSARGMWVLRAGGFEGESDLPFGGQATAGHAGVH
jgi:hypothetical protein